MVLTLSRRQEQWLLALGLIACYESIGSIRPSINSPASLGFLSRMLAGRRFISTYKPGHDLNEEERVDSLASQHSKENKYTNYSF